MNPSTPQGIHATTHPIDAFHRIIQDRDVAGLNALLAEEAVFHSPLQSSPQRGRKLAAGYLTAAFDMLSAAGFKYVRQVVGTSDAVLEFEAVMDGVTINGIDLIHWNDAGQIDDFKVMLRPLDAINAVERRMSGARP